MSLALVTLEDRRAVYALLDRYLDWLPPTRLSVARPERSASTSEGGWRPCGRCAATGRVTGEGAAAKPCRQRHASWPLSHACRPCLACDGGYVRVDDGGRDLMLNPGKHELETDAQVKAERRRLVDAQLVKLAAMQRQRSGAEGESDELSRAHDAKERLWRTGSFARLELCLELLALTNPLRMEALKVFVLERQFEPTPRVQVRLDEIVEWIAERMPRPILLPGDAKAEMSAWKHSLQHGKTAEHRAQRAGRDAEIVALSFEHGWSLRRVGALYDLSPEGVRKIVNGHVGVVAAVASGPAA